jgi:ketosteroid isomerase-like protein
MRTLFAFLALMVLLPISAPAQQWSAEQQEVWQAVVDCWAAYDAGNRAASEDCFHEDYSFWWAEDVLPFGKHVVREYHANFTDLNQTVMYDRRPAGIIVRGDCALVHWGVRGFTRDADGNQDEWVERISMMMIKKDGKWRYLGGGGSPFKK